MLSMLCNLAADPATRRIFFEDSSRPRSMP